MKSRKPVGRWNEILNAQVTRRMNDRYADVDNVTGRILKLAKEARVSKSAIQRIVDPETYGRTRTTVDVVERLAMALRCETYELLREDSSA